MKIILLRNSSISTHVSTRQITLAVLTVSLLSLCLAWVFYELWIGPSSTNATLDKAMAEVREQHDEISRVKASSRKELESLAIRIGYMQAQLFRLEALGKHLVTTTDLDPREFSFGGELGLGGPGSEDNGNPSEARFTLSVDDLIARLEAKITATRNQIETLGQFSQSLDITRAHTPSGWPVKSGSWISSGFGRRIDPFDGRPTWHNGMDFAGRMNSNVVAVAAGVVIKAGTHGSYGKSITIDHGGGIKTSYGHNNELLAQVGDVVSKGQPIAKLGSSGRSTGPHVHYVVYKNGRPVDPAAYVRRSNSRLANRR